LEEKGEGFTREDEIWDQPTSSNLNSEGTIDACHDPIKRAINETGWPGKVRTVQCLTVNAREI